MVQIHHKIGWLVYVCTSINQKIYVRAIMLHARYFEHILQHCR